MLKTSDSLMAGCHDGKNEIILFITKCMAKSMRCDWTLQIIENILCDLLKYFDSSQIFNIDEAGLFY